MIPLSTPVLGFKAHIPIKLSEGILQYIAEQGNVYVIKLEGPWGKLTYIRKGLIAPQIEFVRKHIYKLE